MPKDNEAPVEVIQGEADHKPWSRSSVAYAVIEAMSGRAAAEHARNFVTGNWTDALRAADAVTGLRELAYQSEAPAQGESHPVPMILYCPQCHEQHVDEPDERTPEWDNPPHRSHLCHGCGCIWRPADVATEGVRSIKSAGSADTWGWDGASLAKPLLPLADREAIAREVYIQAMWDAHRGMLGHSPTLMPKERQDSRALYGVLLDAILALSGSLPPSPVGEGS